MRFFICLDESATGVALVIRFGIAVGQRILTNFFVLYDAFLDASLFTVRVFITMIRECMAVRAPSFSASATTGHIWCPVYHNLHKGDRQVVGRHTGREGSLPPHTCTPCSFGRHCRNL